jgi:hypothetical protein
VTAGTKIRLLSANFRYSPNEDDDANGRSWPDVRKALTLGLIRAWYPRIICGQECSTIIRNDLAAGLGAPWRYVRNGNVIIWYDTRYHNLLGSQAFNLPTPPEQDPRRLILARFEARSTGGEWWAASTHFTATLPDWQVKQMVAACDFIKDQGAQLSVIFGGDFNSGQTLEEGPRTVARSNGLFDLRNKLALARIRNVNSNTYNGWQQPCPRDGRWIDDILTGEHQQPYYARVIDTNGASDHQFLIASTIQTT